MLLSTASPEKRIYMSKAYSKAAAGTFILNKTESIHRWYSYLEGYSSCLVDDLICNIGIDNIKKHLRSLLWYRYYCACRFKVWNIFLL